MNEKSVQVPMNRSSKLEGFVLFCFDLFWFVLICFGFFLFDLFCSDLICFVLFFFVPIWFVLFCFDLICFVCFDLFCFVLFCFVCFVLFCFVLFCFVFSFCFVLSALSSLCNAAAVTSLTSRVEHRSGAFSPPGQLSPWHAGKTWQHRPHTLSRPRRHVPAIHCGRRAGVLLVGRLRS